MEKPKGLPIQPCSDLAKMFARIGIAAKPMPFGTISEMQADISRRIEAMAGGKDGKA